jgi:hypothetical protein
MARFSLLPLLTVIGLGFGVASCFRDGANNNAETTSRGSAESAGGQASGTDVKPPGPPMTFEQPAVTDLQDLFRSTNAQALWTRTLNASGVKVQQISQDKQFMLVGPDAQHSVVVQMKELQPEIKMGQTVDVTGVINQLGQDLSQWNVSPEDRQMMAGRTLFVRANSVRASSAK